MRTLELEGLTVKVTKSGKTTIIIDEDHDARWILSAASHKAHLIAEDRIDRVEDYDDYMYKSWNSLGNALGQARNFIEVPDD